MAVPKKKTSKSKKGMRRSHDRVPTPTLTTCECGATSLPHRVCASCGKYGGRQVIRTDEQE